MHAADMPAFAWGKACEMALTVPPPTFSINRPIRVLQPRVCRVYLAAAGGTVFTLLGHDVEGAAQAVTPGVRSVLELA